MIVCHSPQRLVMLKGRMLRENQTLRLEIMIMANYLPLVFYPESTQLSLHIAKQGVKIPIRRKPSRANQI